MRYVIYAAVLLVLALRSTVSARADEPFVDAATARSPSGQWRLRVEPSDPEGAGPARYTMTSAGRQVYDVEHPVTLRECVVSDGGVAVGYAYDNGYLGWGGNLVVLVIGADGGVLRSESLVRDGPALHITPPPPGDPRGMGVMLDEPGGRAIIRTASRESDESPSRWLVYSLADGSRLGEHLPPPPHQGEYSFSREIDARLVPGAGLIVVHWAIYERGQLSAAFQLIDRSGQMAWSRRIDGEYAGRPEGWNWWDLLRDGVQQIEVAPSAFSVVSYAQGRRTRYAVHVDDDRHLSVTEVGSEPAEPATRRGVAELVVTPGELRPLREVALGTPASAGVIDNIHSLCFDDRGRMGWVRWDRGRRPSQRFTLVDRGGATATDVGIEGLAQDASLATAAWLDGDRWIVAGRGAGEEHAWFLDAATGTLAPIEGFGPGSVKRICRTPGGGFVVLRSLFGEYTIRDQVARYGPDGVLVDAKTEPGNGRGDLILDIAVLGDGTLAALVSRDEVKLWAPGAAEPVVWDLGTLLAEAAPAGQPYYADLRADKDGGLIVHDSANDSLLHRITSGGERWQSFHVRGPKGETFRLYDPLAVDPDGRVWASDGARLFRCGEDGRADLALGGPPEGAMAEPVALTLDGQGNIYALEKGTAAVHVFDPAGEPVRVMRPEPGDTPTQDALAWIRVEPDGRVRYRMGYEPWGP